MNDIRFEFAVGKDSAEGIASELVGAGLVDGKDIIVIANNLQTLIESHGQLKLVTFPLVSIFYNLSSFRCAKASRFSLKDLHSPLEVCYADSRS